MQLFPTLENRSPRNIHVAEVIVPDGTKLRAAFVVPPRAKGTVLLLGGRAEFIERYFETINDLLSMGLAVATFDWRGQGGSSRLLADPLRGHVKSFEDFDADVEAIHNRILLPHCPKPWFGLGHSTGGNILLRQLRQNKWLEKAVVSAPLLGLHFKPWPEPIARGLASVACGVGLGTMTLPGFPKKPVQALKFEGNVLTSDPKRFHRDAVTLQAHPELGIGAPTYAWLRAALDSIDELQKWPKSQGPSCPTMIFTAGLDRVVNNGGTQAFLKKAPGFTSLTIGNSQHEILNEKTEIREQFLAAFKAFVLG